MQKLSQKKMEELLKVVWMGLDENDDLDWVNPFDVMKPDDRENPAYFMLDFLGRPENFYLTCKLILNIDISIQQAIVLQEMWVHPFPILLATRGWSKSFCLAVYAILRALFLQGRKIVIVGAGFRQGKTVMGYIDKIWLNAPVLRDLVKDGPYKKGLTKGSDRYDFFLGYSQISALPIGDGELIRGERSNDTLIDEFHALPRDIYERVLGPFSIVAPDPIEQIKRTSRFEFAKRHGYIEKEEQLVSVHVKNQQVLTGTANYIFNHFYDYYTKWRDIIRSGGDEKQLYHIFGKNIPEGMNHKDYIIIRIPASLTPPGYLEPGMLARAKASNLESVYLMEYECVFARDSDGFFRASLLHGATATPENIQLWQNGGVYKDENMYFTATIKGNPGRQYVYGIDPASEANDFAIVILELCGTHRRIVYSWSASAQKHKELVKKGYTTETDFYSYCSRHIRDLMKVFPTENIAIDSQGGGKTISERLHDTKILEGNERPLWPVIEDKPKDTDDFAGLHILHMINFASEEFTNGANHGLKYDFENKITLFPPFDSVSILETEVNDDNELEDCMWEIEELKKELTSISITKTPTGRDHWSTPETKGVGGKKSRQNKDRYSALIMANWVARSLDKPKFVYQPTGGLIAGSKLDSASVTMPDWYATAMTPNYGAVVRR